MKGTVSVHQNANLSLGTGSLNLISMHSDGNQSKSDPIVPLFVCVTTVLFVKATKSFISCFEKATEKDQFF